jgi:hypothetical protein
MHTGTGFPTILFLDLFWWHECDNGIGGIFFIEDSMTGLVSGLEPGGGPMILY